MRVQKISTINKKWRFNRHASRKESTDVGITNLS